MERYHTFLARQVNQTNRYNKCLHVNVENFYLSVRLMLLSKYKTHDFAHQLNY